MGMLVDMVKKYGTKIPGYIKKLKDCHLEHDDKEQADMIFSTVHRCKGMEYDEVTLTNDFITHDKVVKQAENIDKVNMSKLSEEINLLYVAITRAKSHLYIPQEILTGQQKAAPAMKKKRTSAAATKGEDYVYAGERK